MIERLRLVDHLELPTVQHAAQQAGGRLVLGPQVVEVSQRQQRGGGVRDPGKKLLGLLLPSLPQPQLGKAGGGDLEVVGVAGSHAGRREQFPLGVRPVPGRQKNGPVAQTAVGGEER